MFYNDLRNTYVKQNEFLIKDFNSNIQPNQYKLFGILNYCRLPVRRFSSKSLPPKSILSSENDNRVLKIASPQQPKYSLTNLINKSLSSDTNHINISERKKIFQKFSLTNSENFEKVSEINEICFTDKLKLNKSIIGLKQNCKKLKKNNKYKKAFLKSINEKESGNLLNNLYMECLNLKNSLVNINKKRQSFQIINSYSLSSRFTKITPQTIPAPLPRQRFLGENFQISIKETEDTFYGIDENLEPSSKLNNEERKTSISSISFYITAKNDEMRKSLKNENLIKCDNDNSQSENIHNKKKVYISCYEKQFERFQLVYPTVKKLMIFPKIFIESRITSNTKLCENKSDDSFSRIKLLKNNLFLNQNNNNNINEEDDTSLDNHQYFRQAQQLLSSNSSQMQYLIYGFDKNNTKLPNNVEIQPFINGERAEPKENFRNESKNLYPNLPILNRCNLKKPELDIESMKMSNENKKSQVGPALQSYLKRRQQAKIDAQANDYNQMINRARMIKIESDKISQNCDKPSRLSDCESTSTTNELIKRYEKTRRKNSKSNSISSSSSPTSSSSSTNSENFINSHSSDENNMNLPRGSCIRDNLNSAIKSQKQINNQNTTRLESNSENDSIVKEVIYAENRSSSNGKIKHVQFKECETNSSNNPKTNEFLNLPEKHLISEKIYQIEQNVSTLSMMINNVMNRMNNIEINFQEFSDNFVKFEHELFEIKQRCTIHNPYMNYQQSFQQINNSMNNNLSSMNYWNHGC